MVILKEKNLTENNFSLITLAQDQRFDHFEQIIIIEQGSPTKFMGYSIRENQADGTVMYKRSTYAIKITGTMKLDFHQGILVVRGVNVTYVCLMR